MAQYSICGIEALRDKGRSVLLCQQNTGLSSSSITIVIPKDYMY
jgi:hypothetical protein